MKKIFITIILGLLFFALLCIGYIWQGNTERVDTVYVDYIYPNDTILEDTLSEIEEWYRSEEGMRELMKGCGEEPVQSM